MIGIMQAYSGTFLMVTGVATLAAFGLPLLVVPLKWARLLRWEIPESRQLATFLGRSLGAFLCVIATYAIKTALVPAAQPFVYELLLWLLVAMLALHIYGAIRKEQPVTETIEIALWIILILGTLAFWPTA
jgi:hypothetical protein